MNTLAAPLLCDQHEILALIDVITTEAPLLVGDLLARIPERRHATVYRTLGWLLKMDALHILGLEPSNLD
jgi:hypothetical protein